MSETPRARFERLQHIWQEKAQREVEYRRALQARYQETWWAPRGMRAELDRRQVVESRASDALYAYLRIISPRDWSTRVPCSFVREALTYDDATTAGPLTLVPPPAYGYLPSDMARYFGGPLTEVSRA